MTNFIYNDGGRKEAGYRGHTGDCVCRSIAIASGESYQEVYDRLADGQATQRLSKYHSRKIKKAGKIGGASLKKKYKARTASDGVNTGRKWFTDYMKSLGFEWIPTMFIGQGCKVHLKADELPAGRLVVQVSKHFVAVIDGVVNDTSDCSRGGSRCVYGYWKLKLKN